MVLQHKEGHCTDTGQRIGSSLANSMTIVPSLKDVAISYWINPLYQDKDTTVVNAIIVKGEQINKILLDHNKQMNNVYLYGVTGKFNLYQLS